MDLAGAQAAWQARVDPAKLAIVVVGDAATLRGALPELGYPVVELDADGRPVAAN